MSYLPEGTPLPQPNPDDQPYWDYLRARDMRVQKCAACGRFRHPPQPYCAGCGSDRTEWAKVSGKGTVFTYTIVSHAVHPALKNAVPYNIVVVMLDDAGDVRIVSNLIDVKPEDVRIGMPVELVYEPTPDGGYLPRFRNAVRAA